MGRKRNSHELDQLFPEFLKSLEGEGYTATSVRRFDITLRRFGRWMRAHGNVPLVQIDRRVMASFGDDLARGEDGQKPIKRDSWLSVMSQLRVFFRWAVRSSRIASNPVEELEIHGSAVRSRRALKPANADPNGLRALALRYLDDRKQHGMAISTLESRRGVLLRFVDWCEANEKPRPQQLTIEDLEAFLAGLTSLTAKSPSTQGRKYAVASALRVYFRWLVRHGWLYDNPATRLELAVPRRGIRLPLTHERMDHLLDVIDTSSPEGLRDRACLEVLYSTGIRRAELVGLDLDDLDLGRGLVHIRRGKGSKTRLIPIGDRAVAWVRKYLTQARRALEDREPDARVTPALFLSRYGRRIGGMTVFERLRFWSGRARMTKPVSPHVVRHTTATVMLENGADVRFIQAQLGHECLETTANYAHVDLARLKAEHARTHPAERPPTEASDPDLDNDPKKR